MVIKEVMVQNSGVTGPSKKKNEVDFLFHSTA